MQELADFVTSNSERSVGSSTSGMYRCPQDKFDAVFSYEVIAVPSNMKQDPKTTPVLREIRANHRGRHVVVFQDGHVELVDGE
jgi:prepilin-type processing-associated H-X9-DG protein